MEGPAVDWIAYFETMKDWKRLPAYKAEPRLDSLVATYLPQILGKYLGERLTGIVPELPLHIATLCPEIPSNQSWKVDFLVVGERRNWLVEFKTDSGSRRDAQDEYLEAAKRVGTAAILEGICKIEKATSPQYRHKYAHLLAKLRTLGLLDETNSWTGRNPEIEIVYVQPRKFADSAEENVVDFCQIADWLERAHHGEAFETAFADALRGWAGD